MPLRLYTKRDGDYTLVANAALLLHKIGELFNKSCKFFVVAAIVHWRPDSKHSMLSVFSLTTSCAFMKSGQRGGQMDLAGMTVLR